MTSYPANWSSYVVLSYVMGGEAKHVYIAVRPQKNVHVFAEILGLSGPFRGCMFCTLFLTGGSTVTLIERGPGQAAPPSHN